MAEQKKNGNGSGKKTGGAKSASAQKAAATKAETKRRSLFRRQLNAITLLIAGLFLAVTLFAGQFLADQTIGGVVGAFCRRALLGLLGGAGFLLPVALLYSGAVTAFGKKDKSYGAKKTAVAVFTLTLAGALHLLSPAMDGVNGLTSTVAALFEQGNATIRSGGVLGGLMTRFLLPMCDTFGTVMIYLALVILCMVVLSNITVEGILRSIFPGREALLEARAQRKLDKEAARTQRQLDKEEARRLKDEERTQKQKEDQWVHEYEEQNREGNVVPKKMRRKPGDLPMDDDAPEPEEESGALPKPPTFLPRRAAHATPSEEPVSETAQSELPFDDAVDSTIGRPLNGVNDTLPFVPDAPPLGELPGDPVVVTREEPAQKTDEAEPTVYDNEVFVDIYRVPPLSLLTRDPGNDLGAGREEVIASSGKILETLKSFGVEASLLGTSRGPAVTRYELTPAAGVKISKITNLSDDIALSLAAMGVRIEAPIPGKAAIGIEVPNKTVSTVYLRSILESDQFRSAQSALTFCVGKDIAGLPVVGDIAKMPHMLIAGATGSGKSVCINSLLISLLYKAKPSELRLILIDPKVVELGGYNGIPHLMIPVVTDPKKAAGALSWAVGEMLKRYQMFAERGVKDITGYNLLTVGDDEITPLPRIVIVIDELADLMMTAPGEVEDSIMRLAQMARAAGMHLVIATQRPTVNVITGTIKANVPSRIAFAVSSQIDSRTILDTAGAEKLIGKGDMLYYPQGAIKPLRVQGCLVTDREVDAVVQDIKGQGYHHEYDEVVMEQIERESEKTGKGQDMAGDGDEDELLFPAIDCVLESGVASVSLLQRRLKLGYARAARIMDEIEARGIVGPSEGSKPRQIKMTLHEWQEMKVRRLD